MKKYTYLILFSILSAALNFLFFIYAYNKLATPYLHEEQRVENAEFIMFMVLPGFIFLAVTFTVAIYSCFKGKT